ncbi:MAG: RsmB/NOP family class I SAM-dependent RNA methyltransferase, partial [Lentisphaerae bacterium]|nr:RsmB/NOP family class I SAM-dependent RNA methyltransferase [Lentisphaerota bacterium]
IQDLASQAVGLICAPRPGEFWWDVCAGSGGKALHLADLMQGAGTVLATDTRSGALATLQKRLRKHASLKVRSRLAGTARAPKAGFDGVLVDAPCSGLGTWHRNPDARWRTEREQVISQALAQKQLLDDAAGKVRAGGRLVYAVCTLTKAETVDVLDDFLEHHKEFKPCPGAHPLTGEQSDGRFWIWPWQGKCNGMFIAALQRD